MTKVLHLVDSGGLYGAERMLLSLVQEQTRRGMDPMILSAGAPGIEEKALEKEAVRLRIPVTPWRMKPGLNIRESWKILKWAQLNGYQILHSHGFKFNVLLGMIPRLLRKLPMVVTLHGYVHAKRFSKLWVYEVLDRVAIRNTEGIVLVGEATRRELPTAIASSALVEVISNGLDVAVLEEKSRQSIPVDLERFTERCGPLLLGVGRLSHEKGFDLLIESFAEVRKTYPGAGLLIVGEGRQRASLESDVQAYGLADSVCMPGYADCVPALIKRSDLLVMPSSTEGLPITLLEALGLGASVLASPVGDIADVLRGGQAGFLLEDRSTASLAREIVEILQNPEEKAKRAIEGITRVNQLYSASVMAEKYQLLYAQKLQGCQ